MCEIFRFYLCEGYVISPAREGLLASHLCLLRLSYTGKSHLGDRKEKITGCIENRDIESTNLAERRHF